MDEITQSYSTLSTPALPQRRSRVRQYLPTLILLGLAVHLLLPQLTTLEHSLQVIKEMAWWAVALAVLAQFLCYVSNGYLIHSLAALTKRRLSIPLGMAITLGAASVGLVAGGVVGSTAAILHWTRKHNIGRTGALVIGWLPATLNTTLLLIISIASLINLLILGDLTPMQLTIFRVALALLVAAVGLILWGARHQPALIMLAKTLAARWAALRKRPYNPAVIQETITRLYTIWANLRAGGWRAPFAGALLIVIFDILTLYFLFIAAGYVITFETLLAGYGLALFLGKVTLLPNGIGVVEGTMAALYSSLGVPKAVAVLVILAYRILSLWIPTVIGFPIAAILQHIDPRTK